MRRGVRVPVTTAVVKVESASPPWGRNRCASADRGAPKQQSRRERNSRRKAGISEQELWRKRRGFNKDKCSRASRNLGARGIHIVFEMQSGMRAVGQAEQIDAPAGGVGRRGIAHVHIHPPAQHFVRARVPITYIIIVDARQIFVASVVAPRIGRKGRTEQGGPRLPFAGRSSRRVKWVSKAPPPFVPTS